ncbi:MAG TPA: metal-dependent hydrolase [Opitutaceae bacterium]|nr:metal-dependent hydrolase [Opitutaceae bacterium]
MRIIYLGHSCFLVETGSHKLLIDPFISGNELATVSADSIECDFILLSHGHDDHTLDALPIAKRCGATIIAAFELAEYLGAQGAKVHDMNPGGAHEFPFGRLKLTHAIHSSSTGGGLKPVYLGQPCGLLLKADGKTIYHAGDTALFSDMQLIGRGGIDLAMLPIGDNYTMGIDDAVEALGFLKPALAVPMHYNTFPPIQVDPARFESAAATAGFHARVMAIGETIEI